MKRDMELARQILQQVEDYPKPMGLIPLDLPGRTENEISYNVKMLAQEGFVEAFDCSDSETPFCWRPLSLTNAGHEFLDAIRNDTVWGKVKEKVKEQGGSMPFEVLKALAVKVALTVFGLPG